MEGLGKTLWDDNEFRAFAGAENSKNYQNYKKMLEDDYDKNYSIGGNFLNWLGTGLSGGGWSKGDFLKNRGITDETDAYGNAGYFGNSSMGDLRNAGSEYNKGRLAQLEAGKGLFSGVPIIGELLSAPTQVVSAGKDLAEGGLSKWQSGKRDWLSDLGALGESALVLAPYVGSGIKAIRGAGAVAKGVDTASKLGKVGNAVKSFTTAHPALAKVGKSALGMGGWSALGAVNEYGSDIGNHIPETALRVGIGTTLGAAAGGIGYGIDKFANRAKVTRDVSDLYQQYLRQQNGNAITDSSKLLGDGMGGATSVVSPAPRTATEEWLMNRGNLAKTKLGQAIQGVGDTLSYRNLTGNSVTNKLGNLANKVKGSKVGTNVSNLLKTRTGKVIAGGSAGLTLAHLLNNKNKNSGQPSDEELQELYNYVYGGQ